jgi:photosystem II stability/assembly factor-like uncharacterized protein
MREAPIMKLVTERERVERALAPMPQITPWESVGPTNVGGRLTSLVCHPTQPDQIWAGAAGGGVWQSNDAGRTWQPLWHRERVLNVGALAILPANPKLLFCGTGEANLSADSYAGVGLYWSKNGGRTWTRRASSASTGLPTRIGVIAIDPHNPDHMRIGGIGYGRMAPDEAGLGGMYVSLDGGRTWSRETFISQGNYWCHAIVFHPTQTGTIFAAFTAQGIKSGIYRSTDNGTSWLQLTNGLPTPDKFDRTALAIAPSSPDVIYAQVAKARGGVRGIFRSNDRGATWQEIGGTHFAGEKQMTYNNTIAVHPGNPDHVICGGVEVHLSTNGGKNWKKVSKWDAERGQPNYVHSDQHSLVMPAAAPGRVYAANDGGLDVSIDGGLTWENRSNGLAATMFYDCDVAPSDSRHFGGGAQDNGTNITTTGRSDDHYEILGGDGGWMVFDPGSADSLYASYYNMGIFRFWPAGPWEDVSPPADETEKGSVWMVYITLDPNRPATVFTGSQRVWRSRDYGKNWTAISDSLDGSPITAIEVAPADSRRIYVGTEYGGFFRSLDGGKAWSANIAGPELPGVLLTRIETHPRNADQVFVTLANFGNRHLFRSDDAGASWRDIDQGQLPDVPHHALVIPPDDPDTIFVGNDAGVFASHDLGATWRSMKGNLPNTMIVDLVYHQDDGTLTAATYGRSLWRIKIRAN